MLRKWLGNPRSRIVSALLALFMLFGTTTAFVTVTSAGPAKADSASEIAGAVKWAENLLGHHVYVGWCLLFVHDAYSIGGGVSIGDTGAKMTAYQWWLDHSSAQVTDGSTPPEGALVFWGPTPGGSVTYVNPDGHVALSIGNGSVISTEERNFTDVHELAITDRNAAGYPYLGWMMPPGVSASSGGGSGSNPTVSSLPDGTYIKATDSGYNTYIMAGGSPMLVYAWANVGGQHSISYTYTQAQITQQGLMYPRDGTVVRDAVSGALFVVAGGFPFGVTATTAVPQSYSSSSVYVNVDGNAILHLRSQPADGTSIRDYSNGNPYVISGDAPVYVHDPTAVPYTNWIDIDHWDLANELRPYPADGSTIVDYTTSRVYVMAGDAALAVNSTNNIPTIGGLAAVDDWTIQNQIRRYPLDGTVIRDYVSGDLEVVAGGARVHISNTNDVPYTSWINIDENAAANQFLTYPADGTFITDYTTSIVYEIAGGSAMKVTSWNNVGGSHPSTAIDHNALPSFLQYPADGTVLRDYVHGTMYVIAGGSPLYITGSTSVPAADMTNYINVDPNSFSQLLGYPLNGTFVVGYVSGRVYQIQNQAAVYIGNSSQITSTPTPVDDWAITNELHGS